MESLSRRMAEHQTLLKPYAVPIAGTLRREYAEPEDETRFPFQRDRDRIIGSQAFRRLKRKTQVFVAPEGDHFRTRLTHTLDVAHISRDIARTMGLNEDLAECIALSHDLGHPPFGHAGEEALNQWMARHGQSFEHNSQSHRVVTLLEHHAAQFPGLNLNREILEGLLKHRTPHDQPSGEFSRALSLEAQVVNISDEIAYTSHDVDDGLRAGLFPLDALNGIRLGREARERAAGRGTSLRGAVIHLLVTDFYETSEALLKLRKIGTLEEVYGAGESLVGFSTRTQGSLAELRDFLWDQMYLSEGVRRRGNAGQSLVLALCNAYAAHPNEKVLGLLEKTGGDMATAVKDYVAGMTDDFAIRQALGFTIPIPADLAPAGTGAGPRVQLV